MSTTPFKWNPFRVFRVKYSVFGKVCSAVSYEQTSAKAIKDVRERIIWSNHPTFEILKIECKDYVR